MFEVRTIQGDATAANFALGGGAVASQPLVIDNTAGAERLFVLNSAGQVVEMAATVPYGIRVAQGLVTGASTFNKLGRNSAIGTSETYIGNVGGTAPYMPTAAVGVEIVSSSANDTSAGSGARSVTITGLNSSFVLQSETIATNGTSAVAAANNYIRVFSAVVASSGTYGASNAGNITIRQSGAGTSFAVIGTGIGRSQSSHYCVPSGYGLYLDTLIISPDTGKSMNVRAYSRSSADDVAAPYSSPIIISQFDGLLYPLQFDVDSPVTLASKTDLWFTGLVAASTSSVSVQYFGYLIANA